MPGQYAHFAAELRVGNGVAMLDLAFERLFKSRIRQRGDEDLTSAVI
jgi:hypothetical protein